MALTVHKHGQLDQHVAELTATMSDAPSRAEEVTSPWVQVPGGLIQGGEIVLLWVKPSIWRALLDSFPWLVAAVFFATLLIVGNLSVGGLGTALSAQIVIAVGLTRLGIAVVRWVPTWYLLTNLRVLSVHGVRSPRVSSRGLLEIRNTYVQAASAEKWLNIGSITFATDHPNEVPLIWHSVPRVNEVHHRIRRAIENAIDRHGLGS